MPTKRKLPKSQLVAGAYVHCFDLRRNGISVLIALHVQVRKYEQMLGTTKWRMKPLASSKSGTVNFVLTPVPKHTRVDILALDLSIDPAEPKRAEIIFKTCDAVHAEGHTRRHHASQVARRTRLATTESERVFA